MVARWIHAVPAVVASLAVALPAWADSFTPLGDLPGGTFLSSARAISGDGSTVVGWSQSGASGGNGEAFRWTASTGMVGLGDLPGSLFRSSAQGVSQDGSVVVGIGYSGPGEAFRWTASGMVGLGRPSGDPISEAWGVSADGSVVIGHGEGFTAFSSEAFRWTQTGSFDMLGFLPGGTTSSARAISADGSVITGLANSFLGFEGFVWTEAGGMVGLGILPGQSGSTPRDVSADGSTIVGFGTNVGFRWTEAGGLVDLGDFLPSAVSADGSVLAGFRDGQAWISHPTLGDRSVQGLLEARGVDLTGWDLSEVTGISDDGLTLTGLGSGPNGNESWIATIVPEPSTGLLLALGLAAAGVLAAREGRE